MIHLDYSENYKCKQQNEIHSAYFGNKGLFTACAYYSKDGELCKMSITVTTEENDKSRVASMSPVNKVIEHVREKLDRQILSATDVAHNFVRDLYSICLSISRKICNWSSITMKLIMEKGLWMASVEQ